MNTIIAEEALVPSPVETQAETLEIHCPEVEHGAAMWQLVCDTGVLDVNSSYLYLMMCRYFGQTCLVAREAGQTLGFVMGFVPPESPETYFVWQIGVAAAARGRGLATRLLQEVLKLPACREVHFVETTITPSNQASRRLFKGLARRLGAELEIQTCFEVPHFPPLTAHEAEELFLIGPFVSPHRHEAESAILRV